MDLTLNEVASLLQVSEDDVQKWVESSHIPSYTMNNELRFSREEIDQWVLQSQNGLYRDLQDSSLGTQHFNLLRAIHKGIILKDVEGTTKAEIIQNSVHQIADELEFDPNAVSQLLIDRENLMSTAINKGVAVPHTRDFLISKTYDVIVVVYPKEPIDYDALDHEPVHTLFFLFASQDKRHLSLLSKIAFFCNQPEHIELIKEKPEKKKLLSAIHTWEASLSPSAVTS